MLHAFPRTFSPPQHRQECAHASTFAPLTAADYIRLRREAAGLTIAQVAKKIAPSPRDLAAATGLVELIEQPGNVARRHNTLDRLQSAFPFDPDVYRQLATEPADRHPHVCRGCGCSEYDTDDGHPVTFACASDSACVRCAGESENVR